MSLLQEYELLRRIPFFAAGSGIRSGVTLSGGRQIDIAPTVARLLGFAMPDVDGRVLDEILAVEERGAPRSGSPPARATREPHLFGR